jgi:hypothetical protein
MAAGEPNKDARKGSRDSAYQSLVQAFGVPKAYWNPSQVARIPGNLRGSLNAAVGREDGTDVLGILDCIDDLDSLAPDDKFLMAQVAWTESFYREGERLSRDTTLGALFEALDRERRGKVKKGAPTASAILRDGSFRLVKDSVTWPPFRKLLLRPEIDAVLADGAYLNDGILPAGFEAAWLAGERGRPELWDAAWAAAWSTAPAPLRIAGLIARIDHYRPEGLPSPAQAELASKLEAAWALPYQWAEASAPLTERLLPKTFWAKAQAARQRIANGREAEGLLAASASNPRDAYELSLLREGFGTEADLKAVLDQRAALLVSPSLPDWTEAAATARLAAIQVKVDALVAARILEEQRVAEEKRIAEEKRLRAEEAEHRAAEAQHAREVREQAEALLASLSQRAVAVLETIAQGHLQGNRQMVQNGVERLGAIAATFDDSEAVMGQFRARVLERWSTGPGDSIAHDSGVSSSERAEVNSLIRSSVNALRGKAGN